MKIKLKPHNNYLVPNRLPNFILKWNVKQQRMSPLEIISKRVHFRPPNRPDIVIRRTDKCKVFYTSRVVNFVWKTEEYMAKTEAQYQEIANGRCPLADILKAVQTLLNCLFPKNTSPKLDQLRLGHYDGLPKPHKVSSLFAGVIFWLASFVDSSFR